MEPWLQMVVTIVCAVIASSGFWAFIQKKNDNKDVKSQMLIGSPTTALYFSGCITSSGDGLHRTNMRTFTSTCINLMKNSAETARLSEL